MQVEPSSQNESGKVHLNESWEINHWCEELNLRAEELKEIIKKVGPDIRDIRHHLAQRSLRNEKTF